MRLFNKILKSNRGLSLLELIVAVCFLAIVITPIMNSFITSAKVNAKARKLMCANDCAQTIMEGLADKSFYEIKYAILNEYGVKNVSANYALSCINNDAYNITTCSTNTIDTNVVITGSFTGTDASFSNIKTYSFNYTPYGGSSTSANVCESVSTNGFTASVNSIFRSECLAKLGTTNTDLEKHICLWLNDTDINNAMIGMITYSGIEWDGYYFDAVVTLLPEGRVPAIGADEDTWYSYYVQVDIYELKKTGSGFERTLGFDSTMGDTVSPLLTLNTGIKNNWGK